MRKIILIALAAMFIIGATPALAQVAGVWEGTGSGNAHPHPGVVIYPWQQWTGEIPKTLDVFSGKWSDKAGNYGIFEGKQVPSIPEIVAFKGSWYWNDPDGPSDKPVYGGDFEMRFHFMGGNFWCEGTWTTIWISSSAKGTMKGWKVSPD
jgi:hypothetical protein